MLGRATQAEISADIAAHRPASADPNWSGHRTLVDYPPYRSFASPAFGHRDVHWTAHDLTKQVNGEPLGERIVVTGRVVDGEGRPVRGQLLEIWQANAAGRQR